MSPYEYLFTFYGLLLGLAASKASSLKGWASAGRHLSLRLQRAMAQEATMH